MAYRFKLQSHSICAGGKTLNVTTGPWSCTVLVQSDRSMSALHSPDPGPVLFASMTRETRSSRVMCRSLDRHSSHVPAENNSNSQLKIVSP